MASSSSERKLKNLVINKVDSQATFNQMKESGLINTDELYLIKEGTKDRVLDVIVNGESTVIDGISDFNVPTTISELENDSGYITTAEETDPVFSASAAAGITSNDIQNWNNKTSSIGTITGVSINGTSIATSGVANITSVPASILTGAIPNGVTATTQTQSDNSTKIATTAYVDTAIGNLPEPMVFKGSLGTGGTITALPTAAASNEGHTYKVIKNGTYAGQAAKIGDTFISTGSRWELIPSGDEPSGTVTSITLNATSPIAIDNSAAITTSGTRTISHANSGVSAGTYKSVTVNSTGHVTSGTNPTTLSGYGITDAKIVNGVITLGNNTITPLTEHQDITGKQDKITTSNKLPYDLISGTPTIPTITDTYSATSSNGMSGKAVASAISGKQDTLTTQTAYNAKGSATKVPQITTNTLGQVTGITEVTITDNDTKNTAGSTNTSSKIFLVGATSQAANPQTYSHDTAYVGTDGCLYSGGTKVLTAHQDISGKQDKLTAQTAYNAKGSATKVPQITTNTLGQVTGITEVTITQPTVNNATLTIQKNGTNVATFGANASSNVTANITVPTVTDTYSASSSDAMSGKAVASALSSFSGGPKNIKDGDGTGSVYTSGANKPTANYAFAEGYDTQALDIYSHAEGCRTISNGNASHTEGYGDFLTALDTTVHTIYNSENKTIIIKGVVKSPYSKNIVDKYIILGQAYLSIDGESVQLADKIKQIDEVRDGDVRTIVYFEGTPSSDITSLAVDAPVCLCLLGSLASGKGAHAEGYSTMAIDRSAHSEGEWTISNGWASHAEGSWTQALYKYSHAEGNQTISNGLASHAEGAGTKALEDYSHAEGAGSIASGLFGSHAEGTGSIAFGSWGAHAEGDETWAGDYGHSEGWGTVAVSNSHAEGRDTVASDTSHAEGFGDNWLDPRQAICVDSFVVVDRDYQYPIFDPAVHTAKDWYEGCFLSKLSPSTSGDLDPYMCITYISSNNHSYHYGEANSHEVLDFEIGDTIYIYMPNAGALGHVSHSEGYNTIATGDYQHVQGRYNKIDKENKYADIVGNGSSKNVRSNAYTLDWNGNAWFAGDIKIGGTGYDDSNAKVINVIANLKDGDGIGSVYTSIANKPTERGAFAEGQGSYAQGINSHAEGSHSIASGDWSHAENGAGDSNVSEYASGTITSISSDKKTLTISGMDMNLSYRRLQPWSLPKITAVNKNFTTNEITLIFEEAINKNVGEQINLRLLGNQAIGNASHAEGMWTVAAELSSHAEGYCTSTNSAYQHVQGKYNAPDSSALFIIGNGSSGNKSNAITVQTNGSLWVHQDIKVGGTKYDDATAIVLTSENFHQYVDAYVQEILNRRY